MKDIRIEIEIVAMSYFYKIHYDIKKNKIYYSSIGQWEDLEKKISQNDLNIFWENLNNIDVLLCMMITHILLYQRQPI